MRKGYLKSQQESILNVLINKYWADPERFHSYLPGLAQELGLTKQRDSHRSALTELERERLQKALLQLLNKKVHTSEDVTQALEYCATLIQDGALPSELNRQLLLSLLHKAMGIPLSKIKKNAKISVRKGDAVKEIALLHGVHVLLTWDDRLIAILVSPSKMKERSKALKFVGIAKDAATDVAQRHDAYLAEGISNA